MKDVRRTGLIDRLSPIAYCLPLFSSALYRFPYYNVFDFTSR